MSPPYHYLHSSGCECDQECNKPITTSISMLVNVISNESLLPTYTSMLLNVISNVTTLPLSSQQWLWMWSAMSPSYSYYLHISTYECYLRCSIASLPSSKTLWISSAMSPYFHICDCECHKQHHHPTTTSTSVLMMSSVKAPPFTILHISACEYHLQSTKFPPPLYNSLSMLSAVHTSTTTSKSVLLYDISHITTLSLPPNQCFVM